MTFLSENTLAVYCGASALFTFITYWWTKLQFAVPWEQGGRRLPRGFKENVPPWSFSSSAAIFGLTYVPVLIVLSVATTSSNHSFIDCLSLSPSELMESEPVSAWLDVLALAFAFASMAKDAFLFPDCPDKLLALHHLGVILVTPAFIFLPGARCLRAAAFSVPIAELGTMCYCSFICWHQTLLYAVGMTISNGLLTPLLLLWVQENWGQTYDAAVYGVAGICGIIVVIRQIIMVKMVIDELQYQRQLKGPAAARQPSTAKMD
eukprot:TRINITY_DN6078_c5_g1_i1.p1 TRINITY_DN6078_c5_g1~~TRINITY_DN6078_c5_g1_i1.p1  ORF type:complete len:263 (+),score=45.65 TRINITY_DN6078_c5_g1_i1:116-904(+)